MAEQTKIKTAFPALHLATGATLDQLEVVNAASNDDQASAQGDEPPHNDEPANHENADQNLNAGVASSAQQASNNDEEMSDEEFEKILAKKSGGKFTSLQDLTPAKEETPEQIEAAKNKRKTDAHLWAIESGKITKDKYDQAIKDSARNNRDISLALFTAELQAEDKNISTEEAEEIFKDTFHEGAEENSRLRKLGESQINKIANQYRKDTFSDLDEIEPEYDMVLATQNQFQGHKAKVKEIGEKIPKNISIEVAYKNVDGTTAQLKHEFAVEDSVVKKVLDEVRSQNYFTVKNVTSNGKISEKEVEADIMSRIKMHTYDAAIRSMYEAGLKKGEELAIVVMGNKRNMQQTLNDGLQQINRPPAKTNEYPGLKKAMSNQQ